MVIQLAYSVPLKCSGGLEDVCNEPYHFCGDKGYCEHKGVFPPTILEVVGVIIFFLITGLCNAGGIGGGGILVPIFMIFF